MTICIGAIADDYTGAPDLAETLVKGGMRVAQLFGVPESPIDIGAADAVVIALKSRTIAPPDAVAQSLAALDWLRARGAHQVMFKYCSTFDSTERGNIGPVADALLEALQAPLALVCPAFPVNRRTVYMGHLFVGEQLLSESPMRDHPLTPMRDSNLVSLMAAQSRHTVGLVPHPVVARGADEVRSAIGKLQADGRRYAVLDAIDDHDLRTIGQAAADHALITGGSGIALGLPANFGFTASDAPPVRPEVQGRSVVLAGSCSTATRAQIDHVRDIWPNWKIDAEALAEGPDPCADILAWTQETPADSPLLIHASDDPATVARVQARLGADRAGALVEQTMARLATGLRAAGFSRMVVAGGETSGAVVGALDLPALEICGEIDPGVPWTRTLSGPPMALALKSGNFGGVDFFDKAFKVLA